METRAYYRTIDGLDIWIAESGEGPPLLLLHGGLGDSDEMLTPLGPHLPGRRLIAFDRQGHGHTADSGAAFHFADFVGETAAVIRALGIGPVDIVGFSDGGIIGLLLGLEHPDLLGRLVAIGANFHHSGVPPLVLADDSPHFARMQDRYGAISPDGRAHFPSVADRVRHMWATEPTLEAGALARISHPVLVMAGDRDIIYLSHTCALFEALPHGQLAIVPGATHGVAQEKPALVAQLIRDFLG
ncbi:MAG: alpha/beta fold hydrolase [Devosia sp.]